METKTDASYGLIPLRKQDDSWQVLVVQQYNAKRGDSYWTFPKGHAEEDESPLAAATRELAEETGLRPVNILTRTPLIQSYTFVHENSEIHKTVTFWIAVVAESEVELQASELLDARWVSVDEVSQILTHENARQLVPVIAKILTESNI